jgi:glutamate-1-semialdehyde aminotransferase
VPKQTKTDVLMKRMEKVIVGPGQGHKRIRRSHGPEFPEFLVRGKGCRVWDVDGKEYVDYLLSYGPILLGHCYPKVDAAVRKQMREGTIFNVEHPLQIELAEKFAKLIPCAEMAAFFVGGSGATLAATRVARAVTGRDRVIRMGYHGWHDWCQPHHRGVPKSVRRDNLSAPYNDPAALEKIFRRNPDKIAALIMEPVTGTPPEKGYLRGARKLCHDHGALYVLDEVKTGFRFAPGGAQEFFKIKPDLATFGKGMANGYPGSALVGKRSILKNCSDVWLAATFHAETLSLAATLAVIEEIETKGVIGHIWRMGERMMKGLNALCEERGLAFRLRGYPPMPCPRHEKAEEPMMIRVFREAVSRGAFLPPHHPWFISYSHKPKDIDWTLDAVETSIKKVFGRNGRNKGPKRTKKP